MASKAVNPIYCKAGIPVKPLTLFTAKQAYQNIRNLVRFCGAPWVASTVFQIYLLHSLTLVHCIRHIICLLYTTYLKNIASVSLGVKLGTGLRKQMNEFLQNLITH